MIDEEVELQCPHCQNYNYIEQSIAWFEKENNECTCNECSKKFYYDIEVEINPVNFKTEKEVFKGFE